MTMLRAQGEARGCSPAHDDVDIVRDRELVTRAQSGDRVAFDDLYARYYQRLWRFCLKRLGDEHEAEDVAQEAFVRAWKALSGFGGERRFYPWLSVIAAHLCINVIRKRNRSETVGEFRESHLASWENCGEEHVIMAHDWELAARAFAQLSARHRAVLQLREERGWSYRRIAEHEGIGLTAVESVLWRAREALKREFEAQAGGVAGFFAGALLAARRFLRGAQALVQQAPAVAPSTTSVAIGSATAAATAVAAVVTTLGSLVGPAAPSSAVASVTGHAAPAGAGASPLLAVFQGATAGTNGASNSGAATSNPGPAQSPLGTAFPETAPVPSPGMAPVTPPSSTLSDLLGGPLTATVPPGTQSLSLPSEVSVPAAQAQAVTTTLIGGAGIATAPALPTSANSGVLP